MTDWMDYDTHYTERYLGVPREERAPREEVVSPPRPT